VRYGRKLATTVRALVMATVHLLSDETESHPVQPLNEDRKSGVAVSSTTVPVLYDAEQVPPQLMPAGLEVTVPVPTSKLLLLTLNTAVTVKLPAEFAVPAGVVTLSGPVVAPVGTIRRTEVADNTVNDADIPLIFTAVAPVKLLPVIVTAVPAGPVAGEKLVIAGATAKLLALVVVPPGVVTASGPVVAPAGTVA